MSNKLPTKNELLLSTPAPLKVRLCVMMFLQYFVQGCYLPIASLYVERALGFSSELVGWFGSALALGPLFAPFVLGQLVDRRYATQYVLAASHLAAGFVMLVLYTQTGAGVVMVLATLYAILYVPSLMLTNSLTFHHLQSREREFPLIRVFGTIGFIVPAWLIEPVFLSGLKGDELEQARAVAFLLAGVAGVIMAIYCLTLPHTPPHRRDDQKFAPGVVIGMMRFRYFFVLVLITFLVSIVHKYYFVWNSPFLSDILRMGVQPSSWVQRISSIGQISEILVMAGLGMMVSRLGFKVTMLVGIAAYLLRCLIFIPPVALEMPFWAAMTLTCIGQALHGFCFGCFLAAGFMFVDRVAPQHVRGSMQNLYGTFVIGLGFFVGGFVGGLVGKAFTNETGAQTLRDQLGVTATAGLTTFTQTEGQTTIEKIRDWPGMWLSCAALAVLCAVGFALLFPRNAESNENIATNETPVQPSSPHDDET